MFSSLPTRALTINYLQCRVGLALAQVLEVMDLLLNRRSSYIITLNLHILLSACTASLMTSKLLVRLFSFELWYSLHWELILSYRSSSFRNRYGTQKLCHTGSSDIVDLMYKAPGVWTNGQLRCYASAANSVKSFCNMSVLDGPSVWQGSYTFRSMLSAVPFTV